MSFDRLVIAVTVRIRRARGQPTLRTTADNGYLEGAEIAFERRIPILAICRGMQVLNVARGGSLSQDLATQTGSGLDHDRSGVHVSRPVHPIRTGRTALLEERTGTNRRIFERFGRAVAGDARAR